MYSVVIPTFNRSAFLFRSVLSVANQDCIPKGDIEILVIDDGSSDDTPRVMGELKSVVTDQTLEYVRIDHVGQPGTVRNVGLELASEDFVAYCDSDDYWLPHHLATASQAFRRDGKLGMVSNFWGFAQFSLSGNRIVTKIIVPPHDPSAVNTNCRVHRRKCLETVGTFNTSCWGEDQDFFQRIENSYPCHKTGIVTSINGYIKSGNNLTYNFDKGIKERYF